MTDEGDMAHAPIRQELQPGETLYRDALQLRYEVFFAPHGLGPEVVSDERESSSRHFALVEADRLLAYARLTLGARKQAKISQMVVSPARQGTGLGSILLAWLIDVCERAGIDKVTLEARVSKSEFYARHGFRCCGETYPSRRTGLPHVHMERCLNTRMK